MIIFVRYPLLNHRISIEEGRIQYLLGKIATDLTHGHIYPMDIAI